MNPRHGRREVILSMLAALAILSAGCQQTAMQVPTARPIVVPSSTLSPALTPKDTPILLPTPTTIPTLIITETPVPTQTAIPISGPFRLVMAVDEVLPGTFEDLVSTADGTLWLITDEGIARLGGTTWTVFLNSIPGKFAGIDSTGRAWVVNEDATGLSSWNGQEWTTYGVDAGWTPLKDDYYQYTSGGQSDMLGRIWFATSQDVRAFDGNRWTVYTPQELGMGTPIYDDLMTGFEVTVSRSGVVWVTECDWGGPGPFGGRGIRWLDEGIWQGASSPVASGCAIAVAEDSNGRVWAGLDNSLWRYDPSSDTWIEFASPESPIAEMRFGFINSLAVDSHDTVWPILVLCGGASCYGYCVLYHFQDELWTQVGEVGEFDSNYWGPIFDSAGLPWVYWDGGIYRIDEDAPELVSPLKGRFATVDSSGHLWFVAPYDGRDTLWILDDETSNH